MEFGGKKFLRQEKTKFHKNKDSEEIKNKKRKHHDKSFYRLIKQERNDYEL